MYPRKTYTVDEAQKRLERYCAYQERCHFEVTKKLIEMRMIPEARDQIIVHLINNDFLNEERFAMAFVRGKFKIKQWGRRRLELELKKKHISKLLIRKALNAIGDEEYGDTLNALAKKRLQQLGNTRSQQNRKKLADYLLYRGWETHLVYDKVRELMP